MLLLSGSGCWVERCAWRIMCLVESVSLPRPQLRQKPCSCGQALHGTRSLWWSHGLIKPLFYFSFFLCFFPCLTYTLFVFVPCYSTISFPRPLPNLWTRWNEPISCQASAIGYRDHRRRSKGFTCYWMCRYNSQKSHVSVLLFTLFISCP